MKVHFKHGVLPIAAALLIAGTAIVPVAAQEPPRYKRDLPAALVKQATVTEPEAAKTALASVPKGRIASVELEDEGGKLLYSYDIKVPGKSGIDEVHVDAKTGALLSNEHETPAAERKEAAQERAAVKSKRATSKKP